MAGADSAIVTVRLIRNFEYRAIKTVPIRDVDFSQNVSDFIDQVQGYVKTMKGIPPPFKTHPYDTMKISHQAHTTKANDIVINFDDDEGLILRKESSLSECNVTSETEISFFNLAEYQSYKLDPVRKW